MKTRAVRNRKTKLHLNKKPRWQYDGCNCQMCKSERYSRKTINSWEWNSADNIINDTKKELKL